LLPQSGHRPVAYGNKQLSTVAKRLPDYKAQDLRRWSSSNLGIIVLHERFFEEINSIE
jgi:hypothetical protein